MSIQSTTNRNDYIGNGATNVYPYSFRIFDSSDLRVTVRDTNGVETELTINTDYTVSGEGSLSGGSITLVGASQAWLTSGDLTDDYVLTIRRVRPLTQETDIRTQGAFFAETHEDAFDHGIMVAQQQQDEISRSVRLPETIASSDFDASLPSTVTDNPGKVIAINSTGDGLELVTDASAIGLPVTVANGGTGSGTALSNNRVMKSASGTIIEAAAITANRVLKSDANGIPTHLDAITASRLLRSDASGYPIALSAITADRVLVSDVNGYPTHNSSGVTNAQLAAFVNLFKWKRPKIERISATQIDIEANTGTANQTMIVFPDGDVRTVTEDTSLTNKYRRFDITATANFTSGTEDSGLYSGLSEENNKWYRLYAVKSQIDATKFVLVANKLAPTVANVATLNSNFGTNSWVFIRTFPNGDGNSAPADIPKFYCTGNYTVFSNPSTLIDNCYGIRLANATAGSASLTYTYTAGETISSGHLPEAVTIGDIGLNVAGTGSNNLQVQDTAATFCYALIPTSSVSTFEVIKGVALVNGFKFSMDLGSTSTWFMVLTGFYEDALGVGANPLI